MSDDKIDHFSLLHILQNIDYEVINNQILIFYQILFFILQILQK